jgi:cytochrome P450
MTRRPPGPRDRLWGITFYRPLFVAPLDFAVSVARAYGDFAYLRMGWADIYFINRPELIREVLVTKVRSFRKLSRQMRSLRKIEGEGLVVSEGEIWQRHRPMVQGSFHARHFERYVPIVVDYTRRRLEQWQPGKVFDVAEEMNQLALEIIAKVVFDVDWSDQARRLRHAIHVFRAAMQTEVSFPVHFPDWFPLPGKIRQRRAVRKVDELIWQLIRERRCAAEQKGDMLSLMLSAAQTVEGRPIEDWEIRDEAATLFVAGHDTTSAALAWFWYVLARHPEEERRVLAEIDTVLGGRPPRFDDLPRLKYLEMAVKESMRLYPAAGFLFGRECVEDVAIGDYVLPKDSWVFISPYIVQRDARNFPNPEVFDPGRFAPGRAEEIPPYAYIPFGGGPRICIGNSFATMEIILLAATVLQKYRLVLDPARPEVRTKLEIVLRPKGPLLMHAEPRKVAGVEPVRRAA